MQAASEVAAVPHSECPQGAPGLGEPSCSANLENPSWECKLSLHPLRPYVYQTGKQNVTLPPRQTFFITTGKALFNGAFLDAGILHRPVVVREGEPSRLSAHSLCFLSCVALYPCHSGPGLSVGHDRHTPSRLGPIAFVSPAAVTMRGASKVSRGADAS